MTKTTIDVERILSLAEEFNQSITGIKMLPPLKRNIEVALAGAIGIEKTQDVLDQKLSLNDLTPEEAISVFRVIFNQIKIEKFNPSNFIINEKSDDYGGRRQQGDKYRELDIYNREFKEKFLNEYRSADGKPYADETKRVNRVLFGKVSVIELNYDKDVFNFNIVQFEELLVSLKSTTIRSLQNLISTLEQYIDFAIKEGRVLNRENVSSQYGTKDKIEKFLDKEAIEAMYFTKNEIDNLAQYADNAQDGVILSLIFDGVSHKNKFIELRNVRIQDCDFNEMVINVPQLVDEDTGEILPARQVPISTITGMMIKRAMDFEEKYVSIKGNTNRRYKIAESDYILRGLRNNHQIKWENVSQRILRIADTQGYEQLNATTISYSGQVYYANKLIKEEGCSIDEAIDKIIKRFNINDNQASHFYLKNRLEIANKVLS